MQPTEILRHVRGFLNGCNISVIYSGRQLEAIWVSTLGERIDSMCLLTRLAVQHNIQIMGSKGDIQQCVWIHKI
jgi:hypothetical protein